MSHPYQNHITVVIGNPNEKFQTKVSETAFDECRTEEEVWIEYVLRTFDVGTMQIEPDFKSPIDTALTNLLGEEVRLAKPFNGFTNNDGRTFPVIMLYEDYIQDLKGNPVSILKFNDQILRELGDYFKKVIKADWINISSTFAFN
jgi:hypothetical protein